MYDIPPHPAIYGMVFVGDKKNIPYIINIKIKKRWK